MAGLARVAEQRMHRMPTNARHRILEPANDVRNGAGIGVLIEELKAAPADHGTLVREPPDESLDLLRGKLLAAILTRTTPARREVASRLVALGWYPKAIYEFDVRIHARTPGAA
jgi:hypothetical protein